MNKFELLEYLMTEAAVDGRSIGRSYTMKRKCA